MDITTQATERAMYAAGLTAAMLALHRGERDERPSAGPSPLVRAYADGYVDADDDSDEPRGDDAACLAALVRLVFAELGRINATVSAWPDYRTGYVRLDDGLTDEAHEPETLLATLRALPDGAGTVAMWEATTPIAVACLSWQSCCIVTDCARAETE